jgi:tetrahydromethanopterin S-methyltransferase subunit F
MEHAAEIDNIKKDLRITQDSVLLIHQDLKQMSKGIGEMAISMRTMVEVQSDMRLMNERIESRHLAQKETNNRLDLRIDSTNKAIKDKSELIGRQAQQGSVAYNILKWLGITVGALLIASVVASWLYVVALQGVK